MNKTFKYSLLQYTHSQIAGEIINVGIVFIFEEERKIYFTYSDKKIKKISGLYTEFSEPLLSSYLKSFQSKTNYINSEGGIFVHDFFNFGFEKILSNEFLSIDSTTLSFGEIKSSIQFSDDHKLIIEQYYKLFFKDFDEKIIIESRVKHDERYLISKYKQLLTGKNPDIKDYIKESYPLQNENVFLQFDIAWQNGSLNLVKAISFDLQEEKSIIDKSVSNYGYLTLLSEKATKDNIRFDLIVSKPEGKEYIQSYNKAIKVLNDIKAPKSIIEEKNIDIYSEKTIKELLKND